MKVLTFYLCSDLFHPDNIKNYHNESGGKISIAVHKLWTEMGGAPGLAAGLKSDVKVNTSIRLSDINNMVFIRLELKDHHKTLRRE